MSGYRSAGALVIAETYSATSNHSLTVMPLFVLMGKLSRTRFDPQATADARRRILAFFAEHLGGPDDAAAAAGAQT